MHSTTHPDTDTTASFIHATLNDMPELAFLNARHPEVAEALSAQGSQGPIDQPGQGSADHLTPKVARSFEAWRQANPDSPHAKNAPAQPQEEPTSPQEALAGFYSVLADEVVARLDNAGFMDQLFRNRELLSDNQILARQVESLLQEKSEMESELAYYREYTSSFKQVLGRFYVRW